MPILLTDSIFTRPILGVSSWKLNFDGGDIEHRCENSANLGNPFFRNALSNRRFRPTQATAVYLK